ncbi:MAG: hypothetical protein KU37_11770 [Sulfuricurvum sp. PC08-66]|nr:MAG: hypothetical protein KU37_11770 [Sulfuricurvum sp. PC08-66]
MKKLLLLLLTLGLVWGGDAYESLGYERDYAKGKAQAIKEKKLLMLIVVSDSCPWCKALARRVLSKEDIAALIAKDFIPVLVKNNDTVSYPAAYQTDRIPVINYIDPVSGMDLWQSIGFRKKAEFLEDLAEAKLSFAEEQESK